MLRSTRKAAVMGLPVVVAAVTDDNTTVPATTTNGHSSCSNNNYHHASSFSKSKSKSATISLSLWNFIKQALDGTIVVSQQKNRRRIVSAVLVLQVMLFLILLLFLLFRSSTSSSSSLNDNENSKIHHRHNHHSTNTIHHHNNDQQQQQHDNHNVAGRQMMMIRSSTSRGRNVVGSETRTTTTRKLVDSLPLLPSSYYDVVIVGSGPAGLAAAIFLGRTSIPKSYLLVLGSTEYGTQLADATYLTNYPSWDIGTTSNNNNNNAKNDINIGQLWLETTKQQAAALGIPFALSGILVTNIERQLYQYHDNSTMTDTNLRESHNNDVIHTKKDTTTTATTIVPLYTLHLNTAGNNGNTNRIYSQAIILATGATNRKLHLPYEEQLWGKYIHTCVICDGSLYGSNSIQSSTSIKPKTILVIGGGDSAIEATIVLSRQNPKNTIILLHRRTEFRASNQQMVQTILHENENENPYNNNIQIRTPYVVTQYLIQQLESKIQNDANGGSTGPMTTLIGVEVRHTITNVTERILCDGIFLMIGSIPNTQYLSKDFIQLNEDGYIQLQQQQDNNNQWDTSSTTPQQLYTAATTATSMEGIFAAGEIMDPQYKQAITAAADGAKAAIDTERWLSSRYHHYRAGRRGIPNSIPLQILNLEEQEQDTIAESDGSTSDIDQDGIIGKSKTDPAISSNTNAECDFQQIECIQTIVNKYPVVVFSKTWCPYCHKALAALELEGISASSSSSISTTLLVVKLDVLVNVDPSIVQNHLASMTGRRTVPNVFIGGSSIGGGDETVHLQQTGQLHILLVNSHALPNTTATTAVDQ